MKFTDGLWLRVAREVAAENADIEFDDRIVDNMCMQLVQRPEEYDVLVLPNLYGDVLSDLCAGMIGGLGLAPGANFGDDAAVFEPTHGSAPKYKGQNKVNPMAQMLSGMLMLRHLDERDAADRLESAIAEVIARGQERHLRHEADPRRPDRGRDERGRGRDHRQAGGGGARMSERRKGHGRRRRQRRRDVRAGAGAPRLRRRRPRRHQGGPPAGQGARHQPDGRGARLRAERRRLERLRGDRGLGRRRDHRRACRARPG